MKTTFFRSLGLLSVLPSVSIAATPVSSVVAFVDVTVVPMDSERTLPKQTVIVKGDRITEVGPTGSITVPLGAQRIDGVGKFLIPGLAEMHGHNPSIGSPPEMFENVFFLFVANGVTTVRSMLGFSGQLEWREKARRGEIISPNLYLAGPSFTGNGPTATTTPQQAIERVRTQKAEGWDLLKVHPGLKLEVYDAMAKTAKEVGIEFSGHIPADVGLVRAIDRGQRTVDHLDGYIEHLAAQRGPIDPAKLAEIVKKTRDTGTWVVPTMVLWDTILGSARVEDLAAFPELKYMPASMVENWKTSYARKVSAAGFNAAEAKNIAANRRGLLKALADGGANIIFGTDAPQQFSVPGFSVHREMKAMKDAGMSNFAILQSATKSVGDYYRTVDRFGTVAPGQRADLVLLNADPLQDLGNVAKRAGVMVRGKWIPEAEIQARLTKIAAAAK
jgi:imidazolonepropionase-like amidohydrolase